MSNQTTTPDPTICPQCGGPKTPNSGTCEKCYGLRQRQISERDLDMLSMADSDKSYAEIGRKYGVTRSFVHLRLTQVRKYLGREKEVRMPAQARYNATIPPASTTVEQLDALVTRANELSVSVSHCVREAVALWLSQQGSNQTTTTTPKPSAN